MTETDMQRDIQLHCGIGNTRLWRFQVGNFELIDGRRIQVGIAGMSDLMGLHDGRFIAIEVKTPNGRTDPDRLKAQQMFVAAIRRLGGLAGFARSVDDAKRIIAGELVDY